MRLLEPSVYRRLATALHHGVVPVSSWYLRDGRRSSDVIIPDAGLACSAGALTSLSVRWPGFSNFVATPFSLVRQPDLDGQRVSTPVISVFSRRHRRRPAARLDGVAGCCRRPMPSSLVWRLHHQRARVQHHGDMDERRIDGRMQSVKRKERE